MTQESAPPVCRLSRALCVKSAKILKWGEKLVPSGQQRASPLLTVPREDPSLGFTYVHWPLKWGSLTGQL